MPNTIHLKAQSCPSCKRGLEQWTMKVVVVGLKLGARCPACHEFVELTMEDGVVDNNQAMADKVVITAMTKEE
jgi:hypothetical protein